MKQGVMGKHTLTGGFREERPKNIKGELAPERKSIKEHVTNLLSQTARTILNARAIQFQRQLQKDAQAWELAWEVPPFKKQKRDKEERIKVKTLLFQEGFLIPVLNVNTC